MQLVTSLIVVEDEPVIALMVEDLARGLGWAVEGCAYSDADAFALLERCQPHLALLDINLGLATSLAVASSCQDRHIPVVFGLYGNGYSVSMWRCPGAVQAVLA